MGYGAADRIPPIGTVLDKPVFEGDAIVFHTLGRSDLLRSKVFALCDRGVDLSDCNAMAPQTRADIANGSGNFWSSRRWGWRWCCSSVPDC